mgnify:CR=1 FL=1
MTQFTSKAIEESFIRLLNERPLDKITIKDIVDDCGIIFRISPLCWNTF